MTTYHVRAAITELWAINGTITFVPQDDAETVSGARSPALAGGMTGVRTRGVAHFCERV
jgi:hypothetical protein